MTSALVIAGTLASASGAIGSSHLIGSGLRQRHAGDRSSDALLWLAIAFWLALGAVAFLAGSTSARSRTTDDVGGTSYGAAPAGPDPHQALVAALVFAGLYLVSGLLATTASYRHSTLPERRRAPRRRADSRRVTNAEAVGLKITARHLMAARAGGADDRRTLAVFMHDAPRVEEYPEDEEYPENGDMRCVGCGSSSSRSSRSCSEPAPPRVVGPRPTRAVLWHSVPVPCPPTPR